MKTLTTSDKLKLSQGTYKKDRYKLMAERYAAKKRAYESDYQRKLARQMELYF